MAKNAYDEARLFYEKLKGGVQNTANRVSSFVQQNPTPASYVQRRVQPIVQRIQTPAPQTYARQNFQSVPQIAQRVIPQIQQRVAQTPIIPMVRQTTPQRLSQFQAPLEQSTQQFIGKLPQRLQQPVANAFPILQTPSFVGENVRQAGRFTSLKPTAFDVATAPLMFIGGVGAKGKTISKELQGLKRANPELFNKVLKAKNLDEFLKSMGAPSKTISTPALTEFFNKVRPNVTKGRLYDVEKQIVNKIKPASEVQIGEYARFNAPDRAQGKYALEPWYGKERPNQFNDTTVEGRVLKINPKSITIKAENPGAWNDGHIYIVPKDAKATIGSEVPKSSSQATGWVNKPTSILSEAVSQGKTPQIVGGARVSPQQEALATKVVQPVQPKSILSQSGGGDLPGSPKGSSPPSISQEPVKKIVEALKLSKPIRREQEALYSHARSQRVAKVAAMGEKVGGEKGYFAQLGQLKGELPKAEFESIRKQISQPDIDSLFNTVEKSNISVFEKVTAKTGLAKLLGAEGGKVPTRGELELLGEIFPPEFMQAVLQKRGTFQKLFELGQEALSIPKSMMATADLSAAFRQGIALVGRPKQWLPAFRDMFKYAMSEKAYVGLLDDIRARPNYQKMRQSKLALTEMGSFLAKREEQFMSSLPEKIPRLGRIVRGSNRAYTGFLNKLRADTFDDILKNAKQSGVDVTPKLLDDVAKFVNSATGRGDLGVLSGAATTLNAAFFSPRLIASRLNLLSPVYYAKLDPFVRKEALKSVLSSAGVITGIATMASLGGLEVGTDPRSADFLKVKSGNTRWDIGGGFAQYIRLVAQLATGEKISSTTGRKMTVGEGYKPMTRLGMVGDFAKSKLDPVASLVVGALEGKDSLGDDFKLGKEVRDMFIPLVIQDVKDLVKEYGPEGVLLGVPGLFGIGSQTYSPVSEVSTNPTINEQKKIKDTSVDYYIRGNKEQAKKLKDKYKFEVSQEDIDSQIKKQTKAAADAYVAGDKKEAWAIKKDYKLTMSQKDVDDAAKRRAVRLYKDGKIKEAMELKRQYGFTIFQKDVQ